MQKKRILIADDIASNRFLLASTFETILPDIAYKLVNDGQKAIDELEAEHYDLVLLDIEMPIKNGIETIKHIRQKIVGKKSEIPVVALTAHDINEFEDLGKMGFNMVLTKPYSVDKIITVINKFLDDTIE